MSSLKEVSAMMIYLASLYPRYETSSAMIRAYHEILADIDITLLEAAAKDLVSEARPFLPAAGEIRQRAFDLLDRAEGVPSPGEAWASVLEELRDTGMNQRRAEFATPEIVAAAEAVGGISYLRELKTGDFATRARFLEEYKLQMKRRREQAAMLPEVRKVVAMLASGELKMLGGGSYERKR